MEHKYTRMIHQFFKTSSGLCATVQHERIYHRLFKQSTLDSGKIDIRLVVFCAILYNVHYE